MKNRFLLLCVFFGIFLFVSKASTLTDDVYRLRFQSPIPKMDGEKDSIQRYFTEKSLLNVFNLDPWTDMPTPSDLLFDAAVKFHLSANNDSIFLYAVVSKDGDLIGDFVPREYSDRILFLVNVKKNGSDSIVKFNFPVVYKKQLDEFGNPLDSATLAQIIPVEYQKGTKYVVSAASLGTTTIKYDISIPIDSFVSNSDRDLVELSFDIVYVDDDSYDDTDNPEFMLAYKSKSVDALTNTSEYQRFSLPVVPNVVYSHANDMSGEIFDNFEAETMINQNAPIHKLSKMNIDGNDVLCDSVDKSGGGAFPDGSWNGSKYTALRYFVDHDEILDYWENPFMELKVKSDSTFLLQLSLLSDFGPIVESDYTAYDTIPAGEWHTVKVDFGAKYTPIIKDYFKLHSVRGFMINIFGFDDSSSADDSNIVTTLLIDDVKFGSIANPEGLNQNKNQASLSIYPSPAKDIINISGLNSQTLISIYDSMGREVYSQSNSSSIIDVSNLNAGIYILRAIENNNPIHTKFIKY